MLDKPNVLIVMADQMQAPLLDRDPPAHASIDPPGLCALRVRPVRVLPGPDASHEDVAPYGEAEHIDGIVARLGGEQLTAPLTGGVWMMHWRGRCHG